MTQLAAFRARIAAGIADDTPRLASLVEDPPSWAITPGS